MVKKASLNGPNRARIKQSQGIEGSAALSKPSDDTSSSDDFVFLKVQAMETVADILEDTFNSIATRSNFAILSSRGKEAQKLIQIHNNMGSRQNTKTMGCSTIDSPIYVHFHNFPIFVVTVMVVDEFNLEDDTIYLHKIQRFNNKVCGKFNLHFNIND